jgi:hypothetical protein
VDIPFGLFRILPSRVEEFKEAFDDRVQIEKEGISFDALAEIDQRCGSVLCEENIYFRCW